MPKGIFREARKQTWIEKRDVNGEAGLPTSPSMAEGRWERPGDYCCCPWHGWRLGRQAGSSELWGSCPLGEAEPTAHPASWGQAASQPLLQAG